MSLHSELASVFPTIVVECPHEKPLFANEIAAILNQRMGSFFKGVFAKDEINNTPTEFPGAYIVNSDPRCLPGSHWLAIYNNNQGISTYFDVFGIPPQEEEIIEFLNRSGTWQYSNIIYSSISANSCGHYCMSFLLEASQLDLMQQFEINLIL